MELPTRKKQTLRPTLLPKDFLTTVSKLFKKQFGTETKGSDFLVYGSLYPDEVILCLSLTHAKSLRAASMHISADVAKETSENPEKVTEQLKSMVDVAASWFAQSLQGGKGLDSVLAELADMDPAWQPFDWEGQKLHVKLNKNNYALERAANDFLKKAGFEEEDGEDLLEDDESSDPDHLH